MLEEKNEEIKKAQKEIEVLSQDEQERYIYELRQKAIRDEKNIRESGYEDGLEAGRKEKEQEIYEKEQELYELRQKAIRDEKNIRESGYEDGLEAGRKEREQEIKLETARKMLEEGIEIEIIIKITGLTKEEIMNK